MRNLGALELIGCKGPAAFVWPGSHTKLVRVDADGRITASTTTLAGEMTSAVARHTLLAASLPATWPEEPDAEAVAAGARRVASDGLGRCAFLVRIAALSGALDPARRAAFWIGAVVADDAHQFAKHELLNDGIPVWIGGSTPARGLYASALAALHSGPVRALSESDADRVSALGRWSWRGERAGVTADARSHGTEAAPRPHDLAENETVPGRIEFNGNERMIFVLLIGSQDHVATTDLQPSNDCSAVRPSGDDSPLQMLGVGHGSVDSDDRARRKNRMHRVVSKTDADGLVGVG